MGGKFDAVQVRQAALPANKGRAPVGSVGDLSLHRHGVTAFSCCHQEWMGGALCTTGDTLFARLALDLVEYQTQEFARCLQVLAHHTLSTDGIALAQRRQNFFHT
jgi:hypothetical protein